MNYYFVNVLGSPCIYRKSGPVQAAVVQVKPQ